MIPRLYHGATTILTPDKMGVGPLRPIVGVTIHYTGDVGMQRIYKSLLSGGFGYHLVIAKSGEVVQLTYLDLRVYHAGKALWQGVSPNLTVSYNQTGGCPGGGAPLVRLLRHSPKKHLRT